jgi:alkylhydroperoxidase family enzyme
MELPLVFTRAMALAAGWQPRAIDAEVRGKRWTALRRGVYARSAQVPPSGPVRVALDVVAASLATGSDVVGSHETAAQVHGLPLFQPYDGPPILTRDRTAGHQRSHDTAPAPLVAQVPARHRARVHGAPVTSLARTAVDIARKGPALSAVVVLDGALRAGVSRQELEAVLADCRGWPGTVLAQPFVAFADGRAESALESVGRWRMHAAELPPPELQVLISDLDGPIGRTDFCWKALRTVGEADGFGKYRAADGTADFAALRAEKMREDRLRDAGWEVFRFTWDEAVHRPAVIEQRALRAFARASSHRLDLSARTDVRTTS